MLSKDFGINKWQLYPVSSIYIRANHNPSLFLTFDQSLTKTAFYCDILSKKQKGSSLWSKKSNFPT